MSAANEIIVAFIDVDADGFIVEFEAFIAEAFMGSDVIDAASVWAATRRDRLTFVDISASVLARHRFVSVEANALETSFEVVAPRVVSADRRGQGAFIDVCAGRSVKAEAVVACALVATDDVLAGTFAADVGVWLAGGDQRTGALLVFVAVEAIATDGVPYRCFDAALVGMFAGEFRTADAWRGRNAGVAFFDIAGQAACADGVCAGFAPAAAVFIAASKGFAEHEIGGVGGLGTRREKQRDEEEHAEHGVAR